MVTWEAGWIFNLKKVTGCDVSVILTVTTSWIVNLWHVLAETHSTYSDADLILACFSKCSEEIKQQNSELSEEIDCLSSKISAKDLLMDDLHQKLEMAERRIQQVPILLPGCEGRSH